MLRSILVAVFFLLSTSAEAVLREWDDEGATSNWSESTNWTSDIVPDIVDEASIGTLPDAFDDLVLLDIPDRVVTLSLSNGADLDSNSNRITVDLGIDVGTGAGLGATVSELIVRPRTGVALFAIDANTINVGANGQLTMAGGEVDVDGTGPIVDGVLSIAAGGIASGFGQIELSDDDPSLGAPTSLLVNDGQIIVGDPLPVVGEPAPVTLHITATQAPMFGQVDLAGSLGGGTVLVKRNATLKIEPVFFGPDRMTLSANATLDMSQDWVFAAGSTLEINSGVFSPSTPEELPAAPAMLTGGGIFSTSGIVELDQADEELIIEARIDGTAGEITNRGTVRFRGGGGIRGIALTALGGGMMINESVALLNFQGGNTYDTPLINEGVIGLLQQGVESTVQFDSFTQTATGVLQIDIGGFLVNEFDVLTVDGDAEVGGLLEVDLANMFLPVLGNSFEILTAPNGVITGQFDTTDFPTLAGLEFDIVYNAQSIVLEVVMSSGVLDGDFDLDGDVDGADFLSWQRGESPDPLSASDLSDWQTNYGNPVSVSNVSTAIPEPTTAALVIVGLLGMLLSRSEK